MTISVPPVTSIPLIDQRGVEERAARIQSRSLKGEAKLAALKLTLSMLDVTTLEGADSPGKVRQMCRSAIRPSVKSPDLGSAAAVCVYPSMVRVARQVVDENQSSVKVASVATAFPSGQLPIALRLEEVKYAVTEGADEIDMVINRGKFLSGEFEEVFEEIVAVKKACGPAHLKVILETGELGSFDNVRYASELAMVAGADFIKTSTGKISPASTLPVTLVMLQAIKDYHQSSGRMVGMKPAGGISKSKLALQYLVMVREVLGTEWLSSEWFRFGASSLMVDVLMQLQKQETGIYQTDKNFPKD